MTTTEKIAATYLRLNGSLLLSHFTIFDGAHHNHADIIGVRMRNSREEVNGWKLPCDHTFLKMIAAMAGGTPEDVDVGVIVEVKTNRSRAEIRPRHQKYVGEFLGGELKPQPVIMRKNGRKSVYREDGQLCIPVQYAFNWIESRFREMDAHKKMLKKRGSSTLSEEFLADLLVLRELTRKTDHVSQRRSQPLRRQSIPVIELDNTL